MSDDTTSPCESQRNVINVNNNNVTNINDNVINDNNINIVNTGNVERKNDVVDTNLINGNSIEMIIDEKTDNLSINTLNKSNIDNIDNTGNIGDIYDNNIINENCNSKIFNGASKEIKNLKNLLKRTSNQRLWKINSDLFPRNSRLSLFNQNENNGVNNFDVNVDTEFVTNSEINIKVEKNEINCKNENKIKLLPATLISEKKKNENESNEVVCSKSLLLSHSLAVPFVAENDNEVEVEIEVKIDNISAESCKSETDKINIVTVDNVIVHDDINNNHNNDNQSNNDSNITKDERTEFKTVTNDNDENQKFMLENINVNINDNNNDNNDNISNILTIMKSQELIPSDRNKISRLAHTSQKTVPNDKAHSNFSYKNSLTSSRELKKVLANPELFLNAWTAACYEEGCALEREEAILRR